MGRSRIESLDVRTVTDRTRPWSSSFTLITLAIGHWFLTLSTSIIRTTSPTLKFLRKPVHFDLVWRFCKYSFFQRFQNWLDKCCTRRHRCLQYTSSFLNFPGGGSTSFVLPVSNASGVSGKGERGSFSVSTVRGRLLTIASDSQMNVRKDSSSNL